MTIQVATLRGSLCSLSVATLRKPLKREKSRNMGESGRWGKDFRMILGGFAIFAVDIVRTISYNTICIVV